MEIHALNGENIPAVADLMARIRPPWWDVRPARRQLGDPGASFRLRGWLLGEEHRPRGRLLCAELPDCATLRIECLGYDEDGRFVMEAQLEPLLRAAEDHARNVGFRMLRYVISSTGTSCHGNPLHNPTRAPAEPTGYGREHFNFMVAYGFRPTGLLPGCCGKGRHGILMVKELEPARQNPGTARGEDG